MSAASPTVGHFIGGTEVASIDAATFGTVNPATGERLADVSLGKPADVDVAVESAWDAFDDGRWRFLAPAERARRIRAIASLVAQQRDEIARWISLDVGKPIGDALGEVDGTVGLVEYVAGLAENVRGAVFADQEGYFAYSRREPYGVVGAIAPWNFPFMLAAWKTLPALVVGNSVVLKMAEQTPMTATLFGSLCAEAGVPDGVLNVVQGDGPITGASLVSHPKVTKITFTGSSAVGRTILREAADGVKSCHLELGGKTPNIVFPDADLDQALAGSVFTSFLNCGQICTAGTRLLVHEDIADEFVEQLARRAAALPVGDPFAEGTKLGPLVSQEQHQRVTDYLAEGVDAGARRVIGEMPLSLSDELRGGFFVSPTIFDRVEPSMRIAREEIFGPVVTVLRFADLEEALSIANDVEYGLAATLWTNSMRTAMTAAERLEAGIIWTNCPHHLNWHVPYEGHKSSGLGEDLGLESIATFTKLKVNYINYGGDRIQW
jgi:acyl-CoA reductase-like NAD-dependent aldehyde dehydrogenase